jgi:hypothetical protein
MAKPAYDTSSKWLLEHQGRAIALLGGLRDVISCRARQAEVVQPRQLPDGLLEAGCAAGASRCCCWWSSAPTRKSGRSSR